MILLEDAGALLGLLFALFGVGLSVLTGNGKYDGIATLCIGVLLVAIAVILAAETKSLLIGEAALPEGVTAIHTELVATPGVDRVIHLRTLHLGPDELLVAAKIAIGTADRRADVAATIDDEARIRRVLPTATAIYLEPDIDRQPTHTGTAAPDLSN